MSDSMLRGDPAGYIAFEVKSSTTTAFWLKTTNTDQVIANAGWDYNKLEPDPDKTYSDTPTPSKPSFNHFTPILSVKTKVERDYAGINSSGGPQVAGRADHDEIEVTKYSDLLTPILFQFVSTGECFNTVLIVLPGYSGNERVEWLLKGVNMTLFEFEGTRSNAGTLRYYSDNALGSATSIKSEATDRYYPRVDKFRLLYTSAEVRVGEGEYDIEDAAGNITAGYKQSRTGWWGWDTGTNTRLPENVFPTENPEAVPDP